MLDYIKEFPRKDFPVGKFRAFVLDCRAEDTPEDKIIIYLDLILVECATQTVYYFEEVIENNVYVPYSKEFFDFIHDSKIEWEQYEDLIGMTFNATISYGCVDGKACPVLSNRELLAVPVIVGE